MRPTIGRIVIYKSRTGKYVVPAIITATKETLNPEGVAGGFIEDLTDGDHVHLTVFTPGKPGKRANADDFVGARKDAPISENLGGGTYQEWDVPIVAGPREAKPGECYWPERR
jgi:hypothetical protein